MRICVNSSGTVSGSNKPRSSEGLSCTNAVITSFRSSWQMRRASGVAGSTNPFSSKWNCPRASLKPTLVPPSR